MNSTIDRIDYFAAKAMQTLLNKKKFLFEYQLVDKAYRIAYLMAATRTIMEKELGEKNENA